MRLEPRPRRSRRSQASEAPSTRPLITHKDLALLDARGEPFSRAGWIFEIKYDGYRCLSTRDQGVAQMISRQGKDLSRGFPELVRELERLPNGTAIDGELVILDIFGRPIFDELLGRNARTKSAPAADDRPAAIFAWDILTYRGKDLRALPLLHRKRFLEDALAGLKRVLPAAHIAEHGERLYGEILAFELEGIVAKRADAPYPTGRTTNWVKIKTPVGRAREAKRMERR